MAHKEGILVILITLLGCGFPINSVTSKAADQDTSFNISRSLVKNAIEPTLLGKKSKEERPKAFKENELVEIKFEEKRINHENSNSQLDN